jgi:hypothetical protein
MGAALLFDLDRFNQINEALGPASGDHVIRDNPVVGIEEGAMVRVEDELSTVRGTARAKVFRRGHAPVWVPPGTPLPV